MIASSLPLFGAKDAGIAWTDLCIDRLQVWADKSCLHRFDRFNNKHLGWQCQMLRCGTKPNQSVDTIYI